MRRQQMRRGHIGVDTHAPDEDGDAPSVGGYRQAVGHGERSPLSVNSMLSSAGVITEQVHQQSEACGPHTASVRQLH
jgi:hypothetical protein